MLLKNGKIDLIEKYPAYVNYYLAIEILEFIKRHYEKQLPKRIGCQKYVDALNIGIDSIKDKILKES